MHEGTLEAWVTAGEPGPVITLSGETDQTSNALLSALITTELARGIRHLTVEVPGLRFADSAAIRVLVLAAMTLTDRGGSLVLLDPQQQVAGALALTGPEHLFTIRGGIEGEPDPEDARAVT